MEVFEDNPRSVQANQRTLPFTHFNFEDQVVS